MSGGGKGGSQTTQVTIPDWVREAAQSNLDRADQISQIGYVPYYGPDVAAFQPAQNAAFQNTANALGSFGMHGAMPNMPEPTTFAPGVQGYSSAPILEAAMNELQITRPGQYDAITGMFIDPVTGQGGYSPNTAPAAQGGGITQPTGDGWMEEQRNNAFFNDNRVENGNPFGAGGVFNGMAGNVFGDGGFFDDTRFDLGLIDGDGRLGFMAGGGRDGGGGGGGKGG
jgi:hypothetical protein